MAKKQAEKTTKQRLAFVHNVLCKGVELTSFRLEKARPGHISDKGLVGAVKMWVPRQPLFNPNGMGMTLYVKLVGGFWAGICNGRDATEIFSPIDQQPLVREYNFLALAASNALVQLGLISRADENAFTKWFFEQKDAEEQTRELEKCKRIALRYGHLVVPAINKR